MEPKSLERKTLALENKPSEEITYLEKHTIERLLKRP
jgi:hypothetical protein